MLDVLKKIFIYLFWKPKRCSHMDADEYKFWQKSVFLLYSAIILNFALCCCKYGTEDIMLKSFCVFASIYIVVVAVIWIFKTILAGDDINESPYPLNVVNLTFIALSVVIWLISINYTPCNEHEHCFKCYLSWRNNIDAPIFGYVYHDTLNGYGDLKHYMPNE